MLACGLVFQPIFIILMFLSAIDIDVINSLLLRLIAIERNKISMDTGLLGNVEAKKIF